MITGFNTDIEHNGVIYHVQTEDKGLDSPLILSLVYNRGTILASKRSPYTDLIEGGFDENALSERLQKQHKLICAAVRAGRIEDLKKLTAKEAAVKREAASKSVSVAPVAMPAGVSPESRPVPNALAESKPPEKSLRAEVLVPPIPQPDEELVWDLPMKIIDEELVVEADRIVDDAVGDTIVLDDAISFVEPVPAFTGNLEIEFAAKTSFRAGERKTLQICVHRGTRANGVVGAQVVVKVLGSSFRPLIFHARTDPSGIAVVHLQLPQFRSGRAAVLVRALDNGEEAELRQVVRQS